MMMMTMMNNTNLQFDKEEKCEKISIQTKRSWTTMSLFRQFEEDVLAGRWQSVNLKDRNAIFNQVDLPRFWWWWRSSCRHPPFHQQCSCFSFEMPAVSSRRRRFVVGGSCVCVFLLLSFVIFNDYCWRFDDVGWWHLLSDGQTERSTDWQTDRT